MVKLLLKFLVVILTVLGFCGSTPKQKRFSLRAENVRDVVTKFRYSKNGGCSTAKPSFPYITIVGTEDVSELAVSKACTIVSLMTQYMPKNIFKSIARGEGVKLFPAKKGYTVFPEFSFLNDLMVKCKDSCEGECVLTCTGDGRKVDVTLVPGLTVYNRSYVPAENVLCTSGDPLYGTGNILVHEFGHQVQLLMPLNIQDKLISIYKKTLLHPIWGRWCYGQENPYEHWAVATEAFFLTSKMTGPNNGGCGMNECDFKALCDDEPAVRKWLRRHDKKLFNVLKKVYAPKHTMQASGLKTCM